MDTSHTDRPEITAIYTPTERPTLEALTLYTAQRHHQGAALSVKLHITAAHTPELLSFTLSYVDLTTAPPRIISYTSTDGGRTLHYSGSLYHAETEHRPACLEPAELISLTDERGNTSRTITEAAQRQTAEH